MRLVGVKGLLHVGASGGTRVSRKRRLADIKCAVTGRFRWTLMFEGRHRCSRVGTGYATRAAGQSVGSFG